MRSNLDGSTYCIDIVNRLAATHPEYRFSDRRGSFFQYSPRSENLCWMDCTLSHAEMPRWLNQASCALMPTRHDSQGLMTWNGVVWNAGYYVWYCNLSRNFRWLSNVGFISNQNVNVDLGSVLSQLSRPAKPNDRYFSANTVMKGSRCKKRSARNLKDWKNERIKSQFFCFSIIYKITHRKAAILLFATAAILFWRSAFGWLPLIFPSGPPVVFSDREFERLVGAVL